MKKYIVFGILFFPLICFSQKKWTLQETIDYATKNNLQIIDKEIALKLEENNLQITKNERLPSVSGNMSNQLRLGQTQGFQGGIGRNDNFNNDLNVSVNILLYNGGRLQKEALKRGYDVEVAQHNVAILKENIVLQIIQQYLSVLLQKEIVKIYESSVENAQKGYQRAKITTEVGTTAQTTLAEAQSALAKENQNLNQAKIEVQKALFTLSQTLQLNDYHSFDIEDWALSEELPNNLHSLENVLTQIQEKHPLILSAQSKIKSAEAQTEVVKTAFLPSVSLSAGLGSFYYNSLITDITGVDNLGNIIKEKALFGQYKTNFYQQVGVSVNIPIFNKNNTKLQVEQAKINEEMAKNNFQQRQQQLLQQIQKVFFDMESYYQNYLSAQETEKSTQLALDFAQKSYEAGRTSIYDLHIARNNYVSAKSSTIQAKYNYIFSQKILDFYTK